MVERRIFSRIRRFPALFLVLQAGLEDAADIPPAIQHSLDTDFISPRLVINDIAASVDDPKTQSLVTGGPARMRAKVGMLSELGQGLFRVRPETLGCLNLMVGCQPGIDQRQISLGPPADHHLHPAFLARYRPRCQISARTFWVSRRCGLSLPA